MGQRDVAVEALGRIGPDAKAAVPTLLELLDVHGYVADCCYAADALRRIGPAGKTAVPALTAVVRSRLAEPRARLACARAVAQLDPELARRDGMETAYLDIRLRKIPSIRLGPRVPANEQQKDHIRKLIAKFADVNSPDLGFSATISGHRFAPLPGQAKWSSP